MLGLFWVDLSEESSIDFRVSGSILGLVAGFLLRLSGVLSGVVGDDGVVTDGVGGGAFGGVFFMTCFQFSLW